MRVGMILGLVAVLAGGTGRAVASEAKTDGLDGKAALERVKNLAGRWRGNVVTKDGPPAEVHYRVTAGGNTVEETLFPGTPHEMVSMYHLEGGNLVLTHYCAMGNQPRMRLVQAASTPAELRFDFVGGANIDPAKDAHMHGGTMRFPNADRMEADWAVWDKGKQTGANRFFLSRVKETTSRP